jgi:AraC-like DNA-binding protein
VIVRLKDLIERCIGRARRGECPDCENRYACAVAKWQRQFAFAGAEPERRAGAGTGLLAFLADLAGAIQGAAPAPAGNLRREVAARIETLLPDCANVDRVARDLGLSRQTLYRRLKAEGSTFEQLLDSVRRRLAIRMIGRDGLSAKAAAYRLGFSDPAAFSRAFKRWTGSSPSDYRPA